MCQTFFVICHTSRLNAHFILIHPLYLFLRIVVQYHVTSCHVMSCHDIISYHISYPMLCCAVLCCPVLFCPVLSSPAQPSPVHIISYYDHANVISTFYSVYLQNWYYMHRGLKFLSFAYGSIGHVMLLGYSVRFFQSFVHRYPVALITS